MYSVLLQHKYRSEQKRLPQQHTHVETKGRRAASITLLNVLTNLFVTVCSGLLNQPLASYCLLFNIGPRGGGEVVDRSGEGSYWEGREEEYKTKFQFIDN